MVPSVSLEDATSYYPATLGNATEPVSLIFLTLNQMNIHQNEKSTHAGDWLPANGCSAAGYVVSVQAIQALNQHLIIVYCMQQVAMLTSLTSPLPTCQFKTDTFTLQYLPICFKRLKEIPSRARIPLHPVPHQHGDSNTTVKELNLRVCVFFFILPQLKQSKRK